MRRSMNILLTASVALGVAVATAAPALADPPSTQLPGFDASADTATQVESAAASGASFAFFKAVETNGLLAPGGLVNGSFAAQWSAAGAAALPHGAYVVADQGDGAGHSTNPTTDANTFVDEVKSQMSGPYTLPPVIDLEQGATTQCWLIPNNEWPTYTAAQKAARQTQTINWLTTYVATVRSGLGRTPIIYTNADWWNTCIGSSTAFSSYPLWMAHFTTASTPTLPSHGWSNYTFWQWSDSASAGKKFPGDQDVFNGTQAQLSALLASAQTSSPTISGTAKAGYVLTAHTGSTPSGTSLKYQWYQDGAAMAGQTGSTVSLGYGQVGKKITVAVTGTNAGYATTTKTSAATAAVAQGTLTAPTPTISGTAKAGYTLTAVSGNWTSGTSLKYQWYQDGAAMAGQTGSTVSLGYGQVGKKITVAVTGTNAGYATTTKTSAATAAVAQGTLTVGTPTITGTLAVGATLTVNPGTWTGGTSFRYQWYAAGTYVGAGSGTHFTLTSAEKGKQVLVRVIGSKAGYADAQAFSAATTTVR